MSRSFSSRPWTLRTLSLIPSGIHREINREKIARAQKKKERLLWMELPRAPSARVTPKNRSSASSTCFSNPYVLRHDKSIIREREKFGGIADAVLERMGKIDLAESLGHRDLLIRFIFKN